MRIITTAELLTGPPARLAAFSHQRLCEGLSGAERGAEARNSRPRAGVRACAGALRPWQHRCWIFPRDPDFAHKAGRVLDLYHRTWQGTSLRDDDFVVSADEKTSIQARARRHRTRPSQPGQPRKVEHEYKRCGAWAYLAALDVHRARLFGRYEAHSGIAAFDRLVAQVMHQDPYRHARRVFWIVDNGSAHRGLRSIRRLRDRYPNLLLVHGAVHEQLAQPNRSLLRGAAAQGAHAERLRLAR